MVHSNGSTAPGLRFDGIDDPADGCVGIVTGAGDGLGRSHALELAKRGVRVVVNDFDGAKADSVVAEIKAAGGIAVASYAPVGTREAAQTILETALDNFGRVDILVNNAGILRDGAFHKMTDDMIDAVLAVHLVGAMYLTRLAYTLMREQGSGKIIFTTSGTGLFGNFGQGNYAAAKLALVGFMLTLSKEGIGRGVYVNCIAPLAWTNMTNGSGGKIGKDNAGGVDDGYDPAFVSAAVVGLVHKSCTKTGSIITAGGGRYSETFIGDTVGIVLEDASAEAFLGAMDDICARDGYQEYPSLEGNIAYNAEQILEFNVGETIDA